MLESTKDRPFTPTPSGLLAHVDLCLAGRIDAPSMAVLEGLFGHAFESSYARGGAELWFGCDLEWLHHDRGLDRVSPGREVVQMVGKPRGGAIVPTAEQWQQEAGQLHRSVEVDAQDAGDVVCLDAKINFDDNALYRHKDIQEMRNLNEEAEKRATIGDRAADLIAEFGGSWKFILLTIAFMSAWMLVNILLGGSSIDPYPFVFLLFLLTLLQSFQAPIIMMSQNRQGSKDRLRADLDYQVNLKNELALAEVLRRLDVLESERLPLLFAEQNERLVERSSQSTSAS